ncbi:16S rRNA (guanine(527)-N(7))-methyltransferase RsmG, partial [Candidatus Poribacteria bacterium]|nr:16S rRNA (guanine(527)-N(7))-methyltransferase RsmG [Candidatus Poribacteria bacterium]
MDKFIQIMKNRMTDHGFSVNANQLDLFCIYCHELKSWNEKINLTSITDDLEIIDKHFIDSILPLKCLSLDCGDKVTDVGTGAGFPGLPIKIMKQDIELLLVESIGKKASFLDHLVKKLALDNVNIINSRIELLAKTSDHREKYNIVTARCVAHLSVIAEYCLPVTRIGGCFIAYKGSDSDSEIKEAENSIHVLGG